MGDFLHKRNMVTFSTFIGDGKLKPPKLFFLFLIIFTSAFWQMPRSYDANVKNNKKNEEKKLNEMYDGMNE
jgi:hypothetical protein